MITELGRGRVACLLGFVALILCDAGLGDAHAALVLPVALPRPVMVLVARALPRTISVYHSLMIPIPATAGASRQHLQRCRMSRQALEAELVNHTSWCYCGDCCICGHRKPPCCDMQPEKETTLRRHGGE